MKPLRSLPPIPIVGDCPVEQLFGYAQAMLEPEVAAVRWTVGLEVLRKTKQTPDEMRWFALVSLRVQCHQLFTMLNAKLQRQMTVPRPSVDTEKGTLNSLFDRMVASDEFVWMVPLHHLGGTAVFVRKPVDDPSLKKILEFNRTVQNPSGPVSKITIVTRDPK